MLRQETLGRSQPSQQSLECYRPVTNNIVQPAANTAVYANRSRSLSSMSFLRLLMLVVLMLVVLTLDTAYPLYLKTCDSSKN